MRTYKIRNTEPISLGERAANIDQTSSVSTGGRQRNQFDDIAEQYEFSAFSVLDIHERRNSRIEPQLLMTDLDAGIADQVDAEGGLSKCNLFERLSRSNVPFGWKFATSCVPGEAVTTNPIDIKMAEWFAALDLHYGYSIPVYTANSRKCVVTYYIDQLDPNASYPELVLETIECFERTFGNDLSDRAENSVLTDSERNCLLWAAQGKTSHEIGIILSLSEHTVNHYFTIATQKLRASSRTHSVAKAIQLGLIDLSSPQRNRLN